MNQTVIVVPCDELAQQTNFVIQEYLDYDETIERCITVCHSDDYYDSVEKEKLISNILTKKSCIIIGTPQIIYSLINENIILANRIEFLVFDESDVLFENAKSKQIKDVKTSKDIISMKILHNVLLTTTAVIDENENKNEKKDNMEDDKKQSKDRKKSKKKKLKQKQQEMEMESENRYLNLTTFFVGATLPSMLKLNIFEWFKPNPVLSLEIGRNVIKNSIVYNSYDGNYNSIKNENINIVNNNSHLTKIDKNSISSKIVHQYIDAESWFDINTIKGTLNTMEKKGLIVGQIIRKLRRLLKQRPGCLIFLNNDKNVLKFSQYFAENHPKITIAMMDEHLNSNDKRDRSNFLKLLKNGTIQCGIGTFDIGRGLDIRWLEHVIIVDIPIDYSSYLHIAGRVGRVYTDGFVTSIVGGKPDEDKIILNKKMNDLSLLESHCKQLGIRLNSIDTIKRFELQQSNTKTKNRVIKRQRINIGKAFAFQRRQELPMTQVGSENAIDGEADSDSDSDSDSD